MNQIVRAVDVDGGVTKLTARVEDGAVRYDHFPSAVYPSERLAASNSSK